MSDFKERLEEATNSLDLEALFDDIGVDYKTTANSNEVQVKECPFCGDERSRVYFSKQNKRGICFHADCPKGKFNAFSFTRAVLGCSSGDTLRRMEQCAYGLGYVPPSVAVPLPAALNMPESVALPTKEGHTHPYLVDRSILTETQAKRQMRWCEEGYYRYTDKNGDSKTMYFGGRIILPICDLDGNVKTFVARDATGKAELRYLFPPMLPSAGSFLYGGEFAKGKEHAVLGEGPFDAIAISQSIDGLSDFKSSVGLGTFGLSVGSGTGDHSDQLGSLLLLKETGLKRITFLWDGELNAFKKALEYGMLLRGYGFEVFMGILPKDSDPAELDSAVIRQCITEAKALTPSSYMLWSLSSPYS